MTDYTFTAMEIEQLKAENNELRNKLNMATLRNGGLKPKPKPKPIPKNKPKLVEVIKMSKTVLVKIMSDDTMYVYDLNLPTNVRIWRQF